MHIRGAPGQGPWIDRGTGQAHVGEGLVRGPPVVGPKAPPPLEWRGAWGCLFRPQGPLSCVPGEDPGTGDPLGEKEGAASTGGGGWGEWHASTLRAGLKWPRRRPPTDWPWSRRWPCSCYWPVLHGALPEGRGVQRFGRRDPWSLHERRATHRLQRGLVPTPSSRILLTRQPSRFTRSPSPRRVRPYSVSPLRAWVLGLRCVVIRHLSGLLKGSLQNKTFIVSCLLNFHTV